QGPAARHGLESRGARRAGDRGPARRPADAQGDGWKVGLPVSERPAALLRPGGRRPRGLARRALAVRTASDRPRSDPRRPDLRGCGGEPTPLGSSAPPSSAFVAPSRATRPPPRPPTPRSLVQTFPSRLRPRRQESRRFGELGTVGIGALPNRAQRAI